MNIPILSVWDEVQQKYVGIPAIAGRGISSIAYSAETGKWIVTYTDGENEVIEGPAPGQGVKGEDGITPHIGDNGNWFIGGTDTGQPSRGEPGVQGEKGDKGDKGDPGEPAVGGMLASVYDPQGKATDIYQYVDETVSTKALKGDLLSGEINDYNNYGATGKYYTRRIGSMIVVSFIPNIPASLTGVTYGNASLFTFMIPLPLAFTTGIPVPKKQVLLANDTNGSVILGHTTAGVGDTDISNAEFRADFILLTDRQCDCTSAVTWTIQFSDSDIITEGDTE